MLHTRYGRTEHKYENSTQTLTTLQFHSEFEKSVRVKYFLCQNVTVGVKVGNIGVPILTPINSDSDFNPLIPTLTLMTFTCYIYKNICILIYIIYS